MDRVFRLNLINSLSGIKSANLIGTVDGNGFTNVAIFSSVIHLGSDPPLMGFVSRPTDEVRRHTIENILATGFYTINQVSAKIMEQAHYTSAKFPKEISEFQVCGLTPQFKLDFMAPFVQQSALQIGMKYLESLHIKQNDTILVIGQIEHVLITPEVLDPRGYLDLGQLSAVGISGLNSYYDLHKLDEFPYARPHEIPDFNNE